MLVFFIDPFIFGMEERLALEQKILVKKRKMNPQTNHWTNNFDNFSLFCFPLHHKGAPIAQVP